MSLRLGVIGLSPGNGHPYSWSAIFNGYDREAMETCGFPVIPRYLERERFPEASIKHAEVTHIWTQDLRLSEHIARAALIQNISSSVPELLQSVDAVLLARDDVESHFSIGYEILDSGLPVYIDKPLALSVQDANKLLTRQRYEGQLFSCSALRYAKEFHVSKVDFESIGPLRSVRAIVSKDWDKYAVHVLEPALGLIPDRGKLIRTQLWVSQDRKTFNAEFETGLELQVCAMGGSVAPIRIQLFGENGWIELEFQDTFAAFRAALNDFVYGISSNTIRISRSDMLSVIELIEAGR